MLTTSRAITNVDTLFHKNCLTLRNYIKEIIEARKRGETGGLAVEGNRDIISMLLEMRFTEMMLRTS